MRVRVRVRPRVQVGGAEEGAERVQILSGGHEQLLLDVRTYIQCFDVKTGAGVSRP